MTNPTKFLQAIKHRKTGNCTPIIPDFFVWNIHGGWSGAMRTMKKMGQWMKCSLTKLILMRQMCQQE